MNTELKEKMQKAAKEYCSRICTTCGDRNDCDRIDLGRCLPTEDNYDAFISGTAIMYSELAPLVGWVSVEDGLPEEDELVVAKFSKKYHKIPETVRFLNGKFYHSIGDDVSPFFPRIGIDITHWRRIEL